MKISNYEIDVGYTKSSDMFTIYRSVNSGLVLKKKILEIKEKELQELVDSGHILENLRVLTQVNMFDGKVINIYDKEKCVVQINVSVKFKKVTDINSEEIEMNFFNHKRK